jgi:hypothetical protein
MPGSFYDTAAPAAALSFYAGKDARVVRSVNRSGVNREPSTVTREKLLSLVTVHGLKRWCR